MSIWSRYVYDQSDYWPLINALRQKNRYRFGALIQEFPLEIPRHTRAFVVPDGVAVLSWTEQKNIPLHDLKKSLNLLPFFIIYNSKRERLQLQINRDFVRLKIRVIDEASRHEYRWVDGDSVKIKQAEFIAFCNTVTQEIQEAGRYCWVEPQTLAAYDRQVKKIVLRWLTTVARLPAAQAKQIYAQYVRRWWRGAGSREGFEQAKQEKAIRRLVGQLSANVERVLG